MSAALKEPTLDRYRRHVQLYGAECVLETASEHLSAGEMQALERFIAKQTRRVRRDTIDGVAREFASLRRERGILNVRLDRARRQLGDGDLDTIRRFELLTGERDAVTRRMEALEPRLGIARAAGRSKLGFKRPQRLMNKGDAGSLSMRGQRFERLEVLRVYRNEKGRTVAQCRCDCGSAEKEVAPSDLRRGMAKSCGCLLREQYAAMRAKRA